MVLTGWWSCTDGTPRRCVEAEEERRHGDASGHLRRTASGAYHRWINTRSQHNEKKTSKPNRIPTTGHIEDDGTLIELLYDPKERTTALAVWRDDAWTIEEEFTTTSGEILVPYSADNPLIRHQVVMLPSEPVEYGTTEELAEEIRAFIHRYVDLSPGFETAAVTYVLLTWVHDALNELPYLRVKGDYGSGKTRFLLIVGALCRKAFFGSGASTVSPIFHIQDAFRGTLIFDEADFRYSDKKADIVKILNNGNIAGMPVLRTMPTSKGELKPRAFQVFGPKIIASRGSYQDTALESRMITEEMGKRELRADIPINLPDGFREEALVLRNKLLMYRFRERRSVRIDPSMVDADCSPRRAQILLPLLSVAAAPGAVEEISRLVAGLEPSGDEVERLLKSIVCRHIEARPSAPVSVKAIAEDLRESGNPHYAHIGPKHVGGLVRRALGLTTVKSNGTFVVPISEFEGVDCRQRNCNKPIHPADISN